MHNIYTKNTKVENKYDLVIVGSGISCTYTLIHYISLLKEKLSQTGTLPNKLIKVAVLDKSGEFWTGVPYGNRTGKQSLIITALKEFLPPDELERFVAWLTINYNAVLQSLKSRPGLLNQQWIESYKEAMIVGNWAELFIPRYVFGWYLKEQIEELLAEAKKEYLECDRFTGEVLNIQKTNSKKYQIDFTASGKNNSLTAQKVVLAIGSPPNKASFLSNFERSEADKNICAIANMYEPSQNSNIECILDFLKQSDTPQDNKVLIIGSNASALETLYSLNNMPETEGLVDKFIVVSPNAQFPHRIYADPTPSNFIPQNLTTLIESEQFTAEQIFEAVKRDVEAALEQGKTVDSTYKIISKEIITALNMLDFAEQKMFVIKYGIEIGKYQRRAGQDYLNLVDKLLATGKLEFLKGKFIGTNEGQPGFEYITSDTQQKETFDEPIKVVINCAGFQDVTKSSSTLIKNLVEQRICIPNDSKAGFEMTGDFEASENLYLMGPLVAGNINNRLKVWHAESCGRIFELSQKLAEALV